MSQIVSPADRGQVHELDIELDETVIRMRLAILRTEIRTFAVFAAIPADLPPENSSSLCWNLSLL